MQSDDDLFGQTKRRNPFVMVGAIATAGVLVAGLIAFKQGNTHISQQMMRTRVAFQGATLAIMAGSAGVYSMSST